MIIIANIMFDCDSIYNINFFSNLYDAVEDYNNNGGCKSYDGIWIIPLDDRKAHWTKLQLDTDNNKIFRVRLNNHELLSRQSFLQIKEIEKCLQKS